METTKNKLTPQEEVFFNKLSNYLDTKLFFFGSIQRGDYLPNSSDIDVDIFTDNENSTITKMMNFLNVERTKFKKIIWKINNFNNKVVHGYKIMYKSSENNFSVEFSIYNEKNKHEILSEHNGKRIIPFYATILLIILKFLFYTLHIIPSNWYIQGKIFVLSTLIFKREDDFVVIDNR